MQNAVYFQGGTLEIATSREGRCLIVHRANRRSKLAIFTDRTRFYFEPVGKALRVQLGSNPEEWLVPYAPRT